MWLARTRRILNDSVRKRHTSSSMSSQSFLFPRHVSIKSRKKRREYLKSQRELIVDSADEKAHAKNDDDNHGNDDDNQLTKLKTFMERRRLESVRPPRSSSSLAQTPIRKKPSILVKPVPIDELKDSLIHTWQKQKPHGFFDQFMNYLNRTNSTLRQLQNGDALLHVNPIVDGRCVRIQFNPFQRRIPLDSAVRDDDFDYAYDADLSGSIEEDTAEREFLDWHYTRSKYDIILRISQYPRQYEMLEIKGSVVRDGLRTLSFSFSSLCVKPYYDDWSLEEAPTVAQIRYTAIQAFRQGQQHISHNNDLQYTELNQISRQELSKYLKALGISSEAAGFIAYYVEHSIAGYNTQQLERISSVL